MKYFFTIISLFILSSASSQDLYINELMAKNETTIQDLDGDYSDWIELYNASDAAFNLQGYSLSDDINNPRKWIFPAITIPAKQFLLVFASGKDRDDIAELHTNFKISTSGETILLYADANTMVDTAAAVQLSADESYARYPDGGHIWKKVSLPTPNAPNVAFNALTFSHEEGFYETAFSLNISASLGDTIYYTLDGSAPNEASEQLIGNLAVANRNHEPNVWSNIPTTPPQDLISYPAWEAPETLLDKATVLRCATYRQGTRTSDIYTKTYFVDDDMLSKYSMPVISIVTEGDNLFDNEIGIYVPGVNFDPDNEWSGNYVMSGNGWEREIHISFFEPNGELCFSQQAGLKIHGNSTRCLAQKSLRISARKEYGKKYIKYKVFPQKDNDKYKRLLLRAGMGAWYKPSIIKDELAENIASTLNIDTQDARPAIVYINGEYWGIHSIRDKLDKYYIDYTHHIDADSVNVNDAYEAEDNPHYTNMIQFIEDNDISILDNYNYVCTQMDINNFIDYTIAETFFCNVDWPYYNTKMWHKIPDGKWHWLFYDLDAGFGNADYNMFLHLANADEWANDTKLSSTKAFLFLELFKNETYKSAFIDRYAHILNTSFSTTKMHQKLDSIKQIYKPEISDNIKRWHFPPSMAAWEDAIKIDLYDFLTARPCMTKEHIMAYFNLSSFDFECDEGIEEAQANNKLIVAPIPNDGHFFIYNNSNTDIRHANIAIIDMHGNKVHETNNISIGLGSAYQLSLNLADGIYVVSLQTANKAYTMQKMIIAK